MTARSLNRTCVPIATKPHTLVLARNTTTQERKRGQTMKKQISSGLSDFAACMSLETAFITHSKHMFINLLRHQSA